MGVVDQQTLHVAAAWIPAAEQPGRKDARVVEDEQIAGTKVPTQIAEHRVLAASPLSTAEHEQARSAPLRWRFLRDQLLR